MVGEVLILSLHMQQARLQEECMALQERLREMERNVRVLETEKQQLQEEVNVFSAVKNLINRRESKIGT